MDWPHGKQKIKSAAIPNFLVYTFSLLTSLFLFSLTPVSIKSTRVLTVVLVLDLSYAISFCIQVRAG